ncbi:hypothetical protein MDG893_13359 [Marinobacter algicola DG893]|uniref:Uncharacterized protein n=1 Tax=Marinobacter algicola DG893 TaxID=443152 RepID=A6F2Z9_9GAMM|nr:hypothetical protein MDG893_13359 [Marinobacter algicola DG893]
MKLLGENSVSTLRMSVILISTRKKCLQESIYSLRMTHCRHITTESRPGRQTMLKQRGFASGWLKKPGCHLRSLQKLNGSLLLEIEVRTFPMLPIREELRRIPICSARQSMLIHLFHLQAIR